MISGLRAIAALATLLVVSTLSVSAEDTAKSPINGISPAVTHVRLFGDWKTENESGRYRAIILREPEENHIRFFIQKVVVPKSVISTVELKEVFEEKLSVSGYNFEIDEHGLTLFIETANGDTYEVFFEEDGSYLFQPASN